MKLVSAAFPSSVAHCFWSSSGTYFVLTILANCIEQDKAEELKKTALQNKPG